MTEQEEEEKEEEVKKEEQMKESMPFLYHFPACCHGPWLSG